MASLSRQRLRGGKADGSGGGEEKADSGDVFLYSPLKVVVFVGLMCLMLVLMYFFYSILGECPRVWLQRRQCDQLLTVLRVTFDQQHSESRFIVS